MLQRLFYELCRRITWIAASLAFGIRVTGRRNAPASGGALFVCNHQSFMDPVLCGMGIPRPLHYMGRASLFRNPVFRWLIEALNAFPVKPGEPDLGAIKETIRLVRDGKLVLLFPEGTRTLDGTIGKFFPGAALLAKKCRAPVIPVALDGACAGWPRTQKLPGTGQIRVVIGEPIPFSTVERLGADELLTLMRDRIVELWRGLRRTHADLRKFRVPGE